MAGNQPITAITVHCSATPPDVFVDAKVIDRWHRAKGWLKIGYHYVILRDGSIQNGRNDSEVGAHVEGHNTGNLGICLVGGTTKAGKAEDNFTADQYKSLEFLIWNLSGKYPTIKTIQGHRDWPNVKKDCPCFDVRTWVKKIKAQL